MWKKLLIAFIALTGTFTVGYAYFNSDMSATGGTYTASGGTITGKLGSLQTGDHFYIHTNNYSFVVVSNDKGTDSMGTFAMSDTVIGNIKWDNGNNLYSASDYRKLIQSMNDTIDSRDKGTVIKDFVKPQYPITSPLHLWAIDFSALPSTEMPYFIGALSAHVAYGTFKGVSMSDFQNFSIDDIWLGTIWDDSYFSPIIWKNNVMTYDASKTATRGIQPGIMLNNQEVIFAASKPDDSSELSPVNENGTDCMQLRMKDSNLTVNLDSVKINKNGTEIQGDKIIAGTELVVHYSNATVGNGNTVSLIVTKDGQWTYYKRLETANSSGEATIDTSNWDEGTYQFALVNEVLTNDINPTFSSEITSSIPIQT